MAKSIGIQLTSNLDVVINVVRESGLITSGLTVGDTLYQNQYLILAAQKGEIKEYPDLGCGIDDITNDDDILSWQKLIREEMDKDGLQINKLKLADGGLTLEATYK